MVCSELDDVVVSGTEGVCVCVCVCTCVNYNMQALVRSQSLTARVITIR